MSINWERVEALITTAAVDAVNTTLNRGADRARKDVPVRKVFSGGRQTVRFRTAAEIGADRELRSRLGLAPEIAASAEQLGRVQGAGLNAKKGRIIGGKEYGFARTLQHPARPNRMAPTTTSSRRLSRNLSNRANAFRPGGRDVRVLSPAALNHLFERENEFGLTGRGRYELRSQRAISRAVEAEKGSKTSVLEITTVSRLGGGLRSTIRVEEADEGQFPFIKGSLVAGDEEHDYAIHQEMGNRHNPAHPFLRPRLPEWREELPAELRRSLGRIGR